ncbi:unnamed protein product [Orchesella dallaii]|uniref:Glucuronosyltransferase n=1 Tax=Orchesella dallaii TaxID=48710 RepID=A0ABP1S9U8_9HEXA
MAKILCFILIATLFLPTIFSANILFFFAGGNVSHKTSVWPWVLALANKGHNVTFVSPHSKALKVHPNITDLAAIPLYDIVSQVYQVDRFKDRDDGTFQNFDYNSAAYATCKAVTDNKDTGPVLGPLFRDGKFDLVVVNTVFGECGYYVGHYFKAKIIGYTPCSFITWFYDTYGILPEVGWVPDLILTMYNIPMTYMERVFNTLLPFYWAYSKNYGLSPMLEEAAKPLFPDEENLPTLYELENNVSIMLVNSHASVDFARTMTPLFVDIGGMASWASEKELPAKIQNFMDKSGSEGVVLISFGSTVLLNAVSTRYQAMFFHLIHEFPDVRFIMRWNGPLPKFLDEDEVPRNLLVSEWLPQKEILRHPKLKVFVTHGGVSSIQEATYYGVPMIVIPLFADQDYNAYRIEAQQVGLRAEIRGMTEDTLVTAVDKILKDEKFKKNMMKKSAIFRDRPQNPVDTAVFWTEFALRHEETSSTFRPMNQHLNAFQRRLLDVYVFFAGLLILAFVVLIFVLKTVINLIYGFSYEKKEYREKLKKEE